MSTTPNLGLPLLAANQSQPEVEVNEALLILDVIAQLSVVSATSAAPVGSPSQPADGTAYIVPNVGTGDFAGHGGEIAYYYAGWRFIVPKVGWKAYVQDTLSEVRFTGGSPTGWVAI